MSREHVVKRNKHLRQVKRLKNVCAILAALVAVLIAIVLVAEMEKTNSGGQQDAAIQNDDASLSLVFPIDASEETTAPVETLPQETAEAEPVQEEVTEPVEEADTEEETYFFNGIPLYFQTDYPNQIYGSGTVANNGCGITSLAMVATYMTGHTYKPDELASYFGGKAENNVDRLEYASDALQLPYQARLNFDETIAELKKGKVAIVLMDSESIFTESQHFIVLAGYNEDGKIVVLDPYKPNYSHWQLKNALVNGFSAGDICAGFSGGWVYDKEAMPEEPFIYKEEKIEVECRYPDIELTYEEKMLLAKMVWVEAQGEPADGQQAVAEVVLNRLAADNFPDTLRGVIYAEGQFRSVPKLNDAQPSQAQIEAVERALEGPYVLPMDVVFFATYAVNNNIWGQIGGHIFCYQW